MVLAMCAISMLMGCATNGERGGASALPKIAVQYGVAKFIENSSAEKRRPRANRVVDIASELGRINEGAEVTIGFLRGAALAKISELHLEPTDQLLAWNLIDAVQEELEARIRTQVMSSDIRLPVRDVLQWIADAASLYGDPKPVTSAPVALKPPA